VIVPDAIQGSADLPTGSLSVVAVGAGVVGHAHGAALLQLGHRVAFSDIDEDVLEQRRTEGLPTFAMDQLDLFDVDVVLVAVPTPNADGAIDLRHLESAVATIGGALGRASSAEPGRFRVVVIRSTVPPGTTEEFVIPLLEANAGLLAGSDFGVCVSPEFLRQRIAERDAESPRIVVIGELDARSGDVVERLNAGFGCPLVRIPIREAELQKYVHNLSNAAKIALFNELRRVAISIGADAERVFALAAESAESLWNPAYGTHDLGPYGGACLPKDLEAFLAWGSRQGLDLPILSAIEQSNAPSEVR
jgi:UDPglucose 6-dehydrogenase